MKRFALGFATAAVIFSLVGFGVSYARHETNDSAKQYCDVEYSMGHLTAGNRCYFNEVMTGVESNGYIYCTQIKVNCSKTGDAGE